jgi:hypothetical protein
LHFLELSLFGGRLQSGKPYYPRKIASASR